MDDLFEERGYLDARAMAEALEISTQTLRRWVASGIIPEDAVMHIEGTKRVYYDAKRIFSHLLPTPTGTTDK